MSGAPREEGVGEREIRAVRAEGQQEVLHYRNMFFENSTAFFSFRFRGGQAKNGRYIFLSHRVRYVFG